MSENNKKKGEVTFHREKDKKDEKYVTVSGKRRVRKEMRSEKTCRFIRFKLKFEENNL